MIELVAARVSTVLEPSTAGSATTALAEFNGLGDTTLGAGNRGSNNCSRSRLGCSVYGHKDIDEIHRHTADQHLVGQGVAITRVIVVAVSIAWVWWYCREAC